MILSVPQAPERESFKLRHVLPSLFLSLSLYYLQPVFLGAVLCSAFHTAPSAVLQQCQTSMVAFTLSNTLLMCQVRMSWCPAASLCRPVLCFVCWGVAVFSPQTSTSARRAPASSAPSAASTSPAATSVPVPSRATPWQPMAGPAEVTAAQGPPGLYH